MIVDEIGRGLGWANAQIAQMADHINGNYVYVLDDDDFITCENFISGLKQLLDTVESRPQVIVVRGWVLEKFLPVYWQQMPKRGKIASPNMIVRFDIFEQYAHKWRTDRAGDWHFLNAVIKKEGIENFYWWDKAVFYADPTGAKDEQEKIKCRSAYVL